MPLYEVSRLGVLRSQFDSSWEMLATRLDGLTDEEYLWEPVPGCWSVRRRSEAKTPDPRGGGEWVIDWVWGNPEPAPFTTIAWRLAHLTDGLVLRQDWSFGTRSKDQGALTHTPRANEAIAALEAAVAAWSQGLASVRDEDLDTVGFSQFPGGLDRTLPFGHILWWVNRELIHHGAEVGCLRDLYAATRAG